MVKMSERDRIALVSRGHRDELIDFFVKGEFKKLPIYDGSDLSKEKRAEGIPVGWVVPRSCYGWHSDYDRVRREGIRQYIKKHLTKYFGNSIPMVALETWRDEIVIYRRKKDGQ